MPLRKKSPANKPGSSDSLAKELEVSLLREHGPMLFGLPLRRALGYASADAMRQAAARKTLPDFVMRIPHRRGRQALTRDVARWLAAQRKPSQATP